LGRCLSDCTELRTLVLVCGCCRFTRDSFEPQDCGSDTPAWIPDEQPLWERHLDIMFRDPVRPTLLNEGALPQRNLRLTDDLTSSGFYSERSRTNVSAPRLRQNATLFQPHSLHYTLRFFIAPAAWSRRSRLLSHIDQNQLISRLCLCLLNYPSWKLQDRMCRQA
jgi:hypothetical protein